MCSLVVHSAAKIVFNTDCPKSHIYLHQLLTNSAELSEYTAKVDFWG
jgi:hypothetical protein